ncbi:efflux RND transporter periplasmic adaptor subunit [Pectobacterium atrosepticum]|uniref:efflux RND transporter periplasmic adaptor subunit n=1 Tax=Pectobacterium atrosepticum TaxID=29471 RepID=UPI00049A74C7|nr:efflux RND transporter periplasmic adaptor subunit [Pectobacterium atrosepticum]GKV84288.1 RND family efflux transporter MFP subunit [Pectobacterium carotovorum subsp. carotovorum]AIA71793.1 acriflavin resistance protein AcrA [Pectobacterium atrosepticum]AIK14751.1 efflux transporter, RND family, MFP subunit [Pectobacterium atrosepticum]ATY91485.1 efflux RND transporter periplasmic adaptor subunit [Pectobacterium atrosepticum]KFX11262.1 acriflavin resistance protein AcrA [Pectobacterium atr
MMVSRFAFCLLSAVLLSGCDSTDGSPAPPPVRPVKTLVVMPAMSREPVTLTGEIRPHEETALGFRLDGRILNRLVDVGASVKRGDVIATLDARDSENQLRSAQADLASATSAERLAKSNFSRMKALAPGGAIARVQLDEAQANWDAAVSRRESAQTTVKGAQERLSYTQLTSAQDGVITTVSANPGQVVSAGQEVVKLASLDGRDAVFDVPERLVNQSLPSRTILVLLLSDPAIQVQGRVRDISPQADAVTRTFRVRVTLTSPPVAMVLGASVNGAIQQSDTAVIELPASALTRQEENPAVYVVNTETQTVRLQPITVARYSDTAIYITDGLKQGDRVVTAGVSKLRPDEKIRLDEEGRR